MATFVVVSRCCVSHSFGFSLCHVVPKKVLKNNIKSDLLQFSLEHVETADRGGKRSVQKSEKSAKKYF